MGELWDAEVELAPGQAIRLIEQQFPGLAPVQLALLGAGWDNTAFLVNERWVFRFPRRNIAAGLIEHEIRVLPQLANRVPLPIPVPVLAGVPSAAYPYPFAGHALIPGTTACQLTWTDEERAQIAVPLARFLAALHQIPVNAAALARGPGDLIDRANVVKRAPPLKERLCALGRGDLFPLVDRLSGTPPRADPPCWVHGDLYARHLLVDGSRRLSGVIDWGDVHLGDSALDLSLVFSFLPPGSARDTFQNAYGPIDAPTYDRARFRALHYGALLISYGEDVGDDAIRVAGEYALRYALI